MLEHIQAPLQATASEHAARGEYLTSVLQASVLRMVTDRIAGAAQQACHEAAGMNYIILYPSTQSRFNS